MIQDGKILDHIKSFQSYLPDVQYNPHLNFSKENKTEKERKRKGEKKREKQRERERERERERRRMEFTKPFIPTFYCGNEFRVAPSALLVFSSSVAVGATINTAKCFIIKHLGA